MGYLKRPRMLAYSGISLYREYCLQIRKLCHFATVARIPKRRNFNTLARKHSWVTLCVNSLRIFCKAVLAVCAICFFHLQLVNRRQRGSSLLNSLPRQRIQNKKVPRLMEVEENPRLFATGRKKRSFFQEGLDLKKRFSSFFS